MQWPDHQPFSAFWMEVFVPQRIVLLELSEEFSSLRGEALRKHIDDVRYCFLGSYCGGDHRSWQRYTKAMPLPLVCGWIMHSAQLSVLSRRP